MSQRLTSQEINDMLLRIKMNISAVKSRSYGLANEETDNKLFHMIAGLNAVQAILEWDNLHLLFDAQTDDELIDAIAEIEEGQ